MKLQDAVQYVAKRFKYKSDPKVLDYWMVMNEKNDIMEGDCDDFAFTTLWKLCDENIFKFIWCVFILHKYRIYYAKTKTGEKHAVGYAENMFFDNWSLEPLTKNEFLYKTGHDLKFFFPSPLMIIPSLFGLLLKKYRN